MPPRRKECPSYRFHKSSGQAVVTLSDSSGRRRDVMLGKYGSPESKKAYGRAIADYRAGIANVAAIDTSTFCATPDLTVDELLAAFKRHADSYYRHPDGRPTSELSVYSRAVKELRKCFGDQPAASFQSLGLKAVMAEMIANDVSRNVVNKFAAKIRAIWKWAASEQLVPASTFESLKTVAGLQRGRTDARETEPVGPVPDAFVDATLPYLPPIVAAMVELQRLTGCRPGEVCGLRACDLDTSGEVWLYKPPHHKNSWRGQRRTIAIGPRGQAVLSRHLTVDLTAAVFSPRRERDERYAALRAGRRSKVQPSQINRKKLDAKRLPRDCYSKDSYANAIGRAVKAANAARKAAAALEGRRLGEHELIPHWSPNQLRHSMGTKVRRQFSLDHAQAVLGHAHADTTEIYSAIAEETAVRVAKAIG